ncbi:MAG: twin-arginine translocase TatA/TatE family subunit [Magnetococcales bacterium]|nr:twin-arginine translocase TatA/TatE family subunit [Magnetococcales bacterium]
MFGLSWFEFFVILVVALLVIGPDKLPEVARGLARLIRQFQRIVSDVRESVHMEDMEAKMRESSHYTPPPAPPVLPQALPHPVEPTTPRSADSPGQPAGPASTPAQPTTPRSADSPGQPAGPASTPSTPNPNDPVRP